MINPPRSDNVFETGKAGTADRDRAAAAIEDVRKRGGIFVEAIRATRVAMALTDPTLPGNPIVFANQSFLDLSGYGMEEVLGQQPHFMNGPDTAPEDAERFRAILDEDRDGVVETVQYAKDGRRFVATVLLSAFKDEAGKTLHHFLSWADVTRRVEAEDDAAALRKTEAALRESETRLAAAFESVPAGVAVINAEGKAVIANSAYRRFLPTGIIPSRDAERGKRWKGWDLEGRPLAPQDFPGARALRGETVIPGQEMLYTDDDGREIWTNVATAPTFDETGRVTGAVTVISDIDERKRTVEALWRSEAHLEAELRHATLLHDLAARLVSEESLHAVYQEILSTAVAIAESDAGTVQVYDPNTRSLVLLVTQGIGPEMANHFHSVDASSSTGCGIALRAGVRTFVEFDTDETDEACRMHAEAGLRSAQSTPLVSRDGSPIGMLSTHWRASGRQASDDQLRFLDLLARQAADVIEQRRAAESLRESEERLRLILENARDYAIFTTDPEGRIDQWHAGAEAVFGWSAEEIAGQPIEITFTSEDRELGEPRKELEQAALDGCAPNVRWHVRKDGSRVFIDGNVTALRTPDGSLHGFLKIGKDVTERDRAEKHQRTLLAELQHRVRNTLGVVRSIARRTAERSATVDDMSFHFQGRLDAFSRVQAIVTRSPEAGVDLASLIEDELLAHAAREGEALLIEGPEVCLKPRAAESLSLAIHELATNAVKYGALGAQQGRIFVHWGWLQQDGKRILRLIWEENGVDMPAEEPKRHGFGLELLKRTLPYDLRAQTRVDFRPEGLRFEMTMPAGSDVLSADDDSG